MGNRGAETDASEQRRDEARRVNRTRADDASCVGETQRADATQAASEARRAEAARVVVEACYDDVLAYCRAHAPRGCDARDLAQETFLRFVRSGRLDGQGAGRAFDHANTQAVDPVDARAHLPYLITTARNLCIDAGRSAHVVRSVPTAFPAPGLDPADPHDEAADVELAGVLATLDRDAREIVELRFGQGLGIGEIAQVVGASRFAVRRRLNRALALLKEQLAENEGDDR
ncbi:MAG: sigma-70 family RNA polymerase sigma factor [Eggerthellaceae bacterium]|nr:sigma-70 family RNA polymerase sigma factor [Eggerthellaceae bacterium]